MDWTDDGFVISTRRHGEAGVVLELLTRAHGRHLGLVRGGRSRAMRPVLQPGNAVRAHWRARLDEHLGNFAVEGLRLRSAELIESRAGAYGLAYVATLARLLPERDPHPAVHDAIGVVLDHLAEPVLGASLVVRLELALLAELGFGLDLSCCAATGTREDLVFVSPKSGRAVSRAAGLPYADRLLPLPAFLTAFAAVPSAGEVAEGFRLTGYFLARDLFEPRAMAEPRARRAFLACLGDAGGARLDSTQGAA